MRHAYKARACKLLTHYGLRITNYELRMAPSLPFVSFVLSVFFVVGNYFVAPARPAFAVYACACTF
jgi:hypothetical protein